MLNKANLETVGRRLRLIAAVAACGVIIVLPASAGERGRSDAIWIGPWDGLWSVADNWSGGVVPNGGDWNVFIDSDGGTDSSVHVNANYTIGGLTIDAGDMLRIDNGDNLYHAGGSVLNNGELHLDSVGSTTYFRLTGSPVTITGDGELIMGDHADNRLYANTWTFRLINAGNHTIRGGGSVGVNSLLFTNESLVQADDAANTLTIDLAGNAENKNFNTGTMEAVGGGTLALSATPLDNTGGVIQALEGSWVNFSNSTHIVGGTLTTQGSGLMQVIVGNTYFEDLLHEGHTRIDNGDDLYLIGTVTNDGVIDLDSLGSLTYLCIGSPDVTLTGIGEVVLNGHADNRIYASDWHNRLTNTNGHTIRGGGSVGVNSMLLTNESLVQADDAANTLTIDLAGNAENKNFNTGTMEAVGGGTLALSATPLDNTGGVIQALEGSWVNFSNSTHIVGGTLTTQGSGLMQVIVGNTYFEDLLHEGHTRIDNGDDLYLIGTVTNDGVINIESVGSVTYLRLESPDVMLAGAGEVVLNGHADSRIYASDWTYVLTNGPDHTIRGGGNIGVNNMGLVNQGTILADAAGTLTIDMSEAGFTNEGLVHVNGDGYLDMNTGPMDHHGTVLIDETRTLHRDGNFTQTGGFTTVEGTLEVAGGVIDLQGGVLEGTGTVAANVFNVAGTVAPGLSAGTLTIDGNYDQDSCGELKIELGGYTPDDEFDVLVVTGAASLDGIITVVLIDDFIPQIGDTFEILTASSVQGYFGQSCPHFPDLPEGHLFVQHAADSVSLVVLPEGPVYGDVNWDNVVNIDDLFAILANWGPCDCDCCPGDLDGNQTVNIDDVFAVLANWT